MGSSPAGGNAVQLPPDGERSVLVKNPVPPETGMDPLSSVSVIVPVYECAELLPRHLEALETFAHRVCEIIWVITESPDGSDRMAREFAVRLGGRIMEMPRGLYAAWNAGIAAASGKYIYISTVGDVISPDGLTILLGLLRQTGADIAISPPIILPPTKANIKRSRHWPLFYFEKLLRPYAGKMIPRRLAILIQLLSGASGLTGSCASCLFLASSLQKRPFLLDHHHYGDTAWLYHHLPEISLAYWSEAVARFAIHGVDIVRTVDKQAIYQLMNRLAQHLAKEEREWVRQLTRASSELDNIRDPHPKYGWWVYPQAWWHRWIKQSYRNRLLQSAISHEFFEKKA